MERKRLLKKVKSVCPVCLDVIDADVFAKDGRVLLSKRCRRHGKFEFLHVWDDVWCYNKMEKFFRDESNDPNGILIDLTLRCNLECPFCFSSEDPNKSVSYQEPSTADVLARVEKFKNLKSFSTIFFFGGEPTLRKDIFELIRGVKKLGLDSCIFTNGIKLADKSYVRELKRSGLDYVVLQFDSLDKKTTQTIRGKDALEDKLAAISNLNREGIVVDLFSVIVKNLNESDVRRIMLFASNNAKNISNVYFSTVAYEGRGKRGSKFKQTTNSERLGLIEKEFGITKKDFLECTVFDYYFYKFVKKMFGVPAKHLSACDMMCYLYAPKNGNVVPLNKAVNLKDLSDFFDESMAILDNGGRMRHLKILGNFVRRALTTEIIIDWRAFPGLLESFALSLAPLSMGKPPKNNFSNVFRVIVSQFQDKYNLDFDTFRNCNLWAESPTGEINTFCEKNILKRYQ